MKKQLFTIVDHYSPLVYFCGFDWMNIDYIQQSLTQQTIKLAVIDQLHRGID